MVTDKKITHTPGPWRWHGDRALESQSQTVLVGDCDNPSCGRSRLFIDAADARLIAAAPDLLAACQELDRLCSQRDGMPASLEDMIMTFVEDGSTLLGVVVAARKAIQLTEASVSRAPENRAR